jgi:hypothetical protein
MIDLVCAGFIAFVAMGVGGRILNRLGQVPDRPLDALALELPIGFGFIALATLALGELGVLNRAGLALVLAIGLEIGLVALLGRIRGVLASATRALHQCLAFAARFLRSAPQSRPTATSWLRLAVAQLPSIAIASCLGLLILGTTLSAQAPVTDGDALCYHLQVPKVFLIRGSVGFLPDLHETVYPLVTEMLYLIGLGFRGPIACRWIQWVLGLVFAANVVALARPSLGRRAWWAGAIALLVPAVSNGMSAPLNDVALAAFGTAAIFAWVRLHERPSLAAASVGGLLAGLAAGVKYPALVLCALLAAGIVLRAVPRPSGSLGRTRWLGLAAVYVGVAAIVGGCWYLRAYLQTGNPVFPFFRHFFGGAGLDEVLDPIKRPLELTLWNLVFALGPLTLRPDRFDSFSHQFGPVFLLFLPALFFERAPRRVLALVALVFGFLTICLTLRQSMRFLLLALGPMSVGVAYLASSWWDRRTVPARLLLAVLFVALGFEAGIALSRSRHALAVIWGRESVSDYLERREPTYQVGRWAARNLPAKARLIGQDHRGFYIPRDYTMELAHRRRTGLGQRGEPADEIVQRLRASGFTHLMMCPPVPETAVEFDPTLGRLLAPWLARHEPVYRRDLADGDGIVRRYAIYEIRDERLSMGSTEELRR